MPLTFASLKDAIKHTLGGDPADGASYSRIINGAGRSWTAARDWYYLANREATLTATIGSEWVALPDDYLSFKHVEPVGDGYATIMVVSPQRFVQIKEVGIVGMVSSYVATVVQREVAGVIGAYLRLYPTPTIADQFTLLYDATWGEVNDDEDNIPIPGYAEHAFEEWVRTYARGLDEEDTADLAQRLMALKQSDVFRDVGRKDALTTGAVLHASPGAASQFEGRYVRWNHPGNLSQ